MKILDPGHNFKITTFGGNTYFDTIQFIKKKGDQYPGNENSYPGTITQELIRVIISRSQYVNNQKFAWENIVIIFLMRLSLYFLEFRATMKHKKVFCSNLFTIEQKDYCKKCGHIKCFCNKNS